jgi:plasmid maintenance system antidote protein VapI
MRRANKARLEAAGWRVGDAAEFLELTPEEAAFIEVKLALAAHLRATRVRHGWTQADVARRIGSSQSRVARMEAADASVTLDLIVRSLLALGASAEEVGRVISRAA